MISDTIASFLEQNSVGTLGVSIFVNTMPLECNEGILLRPEYSGFKYDWEIPGFFMGRVRVIARSANYDNSIQLIENVLAVLPQYETTIGTTYFRYIRPFQKPQTFPVTQANLFETMFDLDICYSE